MTSSEPPSGHERSIRVAVLGLLVNAALALIKLVVGLIGHSYALVADAVESFVDIFSSLIVWGGLRIAGQPADREHPYGHGKAEALAGLLVCLLLLAAGVGIAIQAIREIVTPHRAPAFFTLPVLVAVVLTKETLFRVARRTARAAGSGAVLADAWHHRSDAMTSAAAFVGISAGLLGGPGWEPADDWAALFASGVILFNASRLIRVPLNDLMDAESPEITRQARAAAGGVPGVRGIEKVFARKSGLQYWIDMHVEVDPNMTVAAAHGVAHHVKDAVRAAMPQVRDVLIHVEPADAERDSPPA